MASVTVNQSELTRFYDDVAPLSDEERAMIARTDLSEDQYKAATGVPALWGDQRYSIRERICATVPAWPGSGTSGIWAAEML